MKSQQNGVCKPFILVVLLSRLSSSYPIFNEDSVKKLVCQPSLAKELDLRYYPTAASFARDKDRVFSLGDRGSSEEPRDLSTLLKGGMMCEGLARSAGLQVVLDTAQDLESEQIQKAMLLVVPASYQLPSSSLIQFSCPHSVYCLNITFTEPEYMPQRLHRRAASYMISEGSSHDPRGGVQTQTIVGVVVLVVGLLILVSVLALCGASSNYDTTNNIIDQKRSGAEVAVSATPSEPSTSQITTTKVEAVAQTNQNGSASSDRPPSTDNSLSPPLTDPRPPVNTTEQMERARTLSARSHDPLPELPKLDLAEKLPETFDDSKDDDEAPYSYARVPKADRPQSDSSDEAVDSPKKTAGSDSTVAIPPYGKVTSSDKKRMSLNDIIGEYAEVTGEGKRDRSVTVPVDPAEMARMHDNRGFTESATHLPLPAIPKVQTTLEEENEMYDSIPDAVSQKKTQPAKIKKERLYESVDELTNEADEDMYESVPEELKLESPLILTPPPLTPSSPERPLLPSSPPRPPDSPIPTHKQLGSELKIEESHKKKKWDKKALDKTVSIGVVDEKKRSFSLFHRKKATSLSEGLAGKLKKKPEKEPQSPKPHQHDPLPDIPTQPSPSHSPTSPQNPLPSTPENKDEEDMYDKPYPLAPTGSLDSDASPKPALTTEEAKARAKTLPASGRSSGFKFNQALPLPEVPEDSGQGTMTVTHSRHLEEDTEITKAYDIIHISPEPTIEDEEEPNYDTVRPELILDPSSEVRQDPDPGYDKVGIRLEDAEESDLLLDEEKVSEQSSNPTMNGEVQITAVSSPELEDSQAEGGPTPDHDEVGYARVPEMYRMRKRALSASQSAMEEIRKRGSQKTSVDDSDIRRETSPEQMYAIVDKAKKSKPKKREEQEHDVSERALENSPIPPPIPPIGDLGDLSEFDQPPLPERSEDAEYLVVDAENESGYSKVLKPSQNNGSDPPYAKVKSKVEHPYAELDIGGGAPPDLAVDDSAAGYDSVGDLARRESTSPSSATKLGQNGELNTCDTLGPASASSPTEVTIEITTPEPDEPTAQNTHDVLGPASDKSVQNGHIEEGPYEEINEQTRQNLQNLHQAKST